MTAVSPASSVPLLCPNAIDRTAPVGSLSLDITANFLFGIYTQHEFCFSISSSIQDWLCDCKHYILSKLPELKAVKPHHPNPCKRGKGI